MSVTQSSISRLEQWLLAEHTKCAISPKIEIRNTEYGGRGVVANEPINSNVPIIKVSHSYLLNFTSVIAHITSWNANIELPVSYKHIKVQSGENTSDNDDIVDEFYAKVSLQELLELTSFQIISLYLVLEKQRGDKSWWKPFIDSLPSIDDFTSSPFIWKVSKKEELLELLPKSARDHANEMYGKFQEDLRVVSELLETHNVSKYLNIDAFLLAWMCINSRCLYMKIPESKNNEGNFTMAPYVDFLNHSSNDQCTLKIDRSGFYVKTPDGANYDNDEELFLSYGPHSNEFLLCEYGFTLEENEWNDIDITDSILELLTEQQIEYLKEKDYFGDYTLTSDTVSFRTEIALAVAQENSDLYLNRRLDAYLNGITDGSFYKNISNRLLKRILLKLKESSQGYLDQLKKDANVNEKVIGKLHKDRLHIIEEKLKSMS
jgi:hypothetical protein